MRVLVTGGAGYIGSHVALQLHEAGHDVVTFDNLCAGHRWAVLRGAFVEGDLADGPAVDRLLSEGSFEAVLHFAAHIIVPESVTEPLKYYGNNTRNTLGLVEACVRHGVERLVFSSTAAVYGMPGVAEIDESTPLAPINPYGASKMMSERIILDTCAASSLRAVLLRYFNVAGADPAGRIGQATPVATHLIKVASQAALGQREGLEIFGTDYPTPDGTCIRDYIHVNDLAAAHVRALDYLAGGGETRALNCGYGHGSSVREVVAMVKRVSGVDFPVRESGRRAGDPPVLVASNGAVREALGWEPRHDDLESIVATALEFERRLGEGRVGEPGAPGGAG